MRELSTIVWAHRPGIQPDLERLNSKIRDQRTACFFASIVTLVPVPLFIQKEYKELNHDQSKLSTTNMQFYQMATVLQTVCSLLLILALCCVLDTFKKVFGRQSLVNVRKIRLFVIIFNIVFAFESLSNILSIVDRIPQVPSFESYWAIGLWALMFLLYDSMAILFLVHTHHQAFRPIPTGSTHEAPLSVVIES